MTMDFSAFQLNTRLAALMDIDPKLLEILEGRIDAAISGGLSDATPTPSTEPVRTKTEHGHEHPPGEEEYDGEPEPDTIPIGGQGNPAEGGAYIKNIDGGAAVRVTSPYGIRMHPVDKTRKMHNGVDLGMKIGEKVYSIGDGTVTAVRESSTSGKYVEIRLEDGRQVSYAHLSRWFVAKGQSVARLQQVGLVGNTGKTTGPHLHLIVKSPDSNGRLRTRTPTAEEIRLAIGGRDITTPKSRESALMPFTIKRAVNVLIEPFDSLIQETINEMEKIKPGYFSGIAKVIVESGAPQHFGKVMSDKPDTIYISLQKIKSISSGDHKDEATKLALMETLAHEVGHLRSNFQGGEGPAEAESKKFMEAANAS